MNDGGDCRTAPATPGLLIISQATGKKKKEKEKKPQAWQTFYFSIILSGFLEAYREFTGT